VHLIQARLAVALGFSTAAHVGLAWRVNGQLASNAAPALRALTVAMTPAAPRAVLNSIAPAATAALSPELVQPLAPQSVQAIEEADAVVDLGSAERAQERHAPLVKTNSAEHRLRARDAEPSMVAVAVAPSQMRVSSALQREEIKKPLPPRAQSAPAASENVPAPQPSRSAASSLARTSAHGTSGSGADAGASQAVAGQPGANREALPASGNEPPVYPWSARAQGHHGRVLLSVWVSAEGHADDLAVLKSSGYPILDRAAVEAVAHWRFQPARRGGLDRDSLLYVPVVFRLDDEG
jgi:protein TonB